MKHSKVVPRFYDLLVRHFCLDLRGLPVCSFQDRPCLQKARSKKYIFLISRSHSLGEQLT